MTKSYVIISSVVFLTVFGILLVSGTAYAATPSEIGLTNSFGSGYADPIWVANTSTSSWIVYAKGTCAELQWKNYNYLSTFVLSQKSDVVIYGRFAVDDVLLNTTVNGYDVGVSGGGLTSWKNFTMTIPAEKTNIGANTIAFNLQDTACWITGFRVEFTSVQITPQNNTCTSFAYTNWSACSLYGTQTRSVINSYPTGCTGGNPITSQSCTPTQVCTDNDWTYILSPSTCPSTGVQTKTWTKIGNCTGGVNHSAYETVNCNYQAPTCTSWAYTSWSACNSSGTQTRTVVASYPTGCTNGNPITSQSCTPINNLSVFCYATPNPVNANQSVSFICNVSGGTGNYTYSWTGACSGTSPVCTTSFANAGTQTATALVTSGSQTNSASASLTINGNNNNCTYHSYQQCIGNNLYWYDSCGAQQDISQYCTNGCSGNSCSNNSYNPYGNCTYHAYKLCVGNSTYWYDSCGTQQDLFQTCTGANMVCKYGQCTYQQPYVPPYNPYVSHYKIACNANSLYWYDSLGKTSGLYKDCSDSNSCTIDSCAGNKCLNTIKCDGSTCATESADYKTYCASQNPTPIPVPTPTQNNLAISFFAKQEQSSPQWQKTVQLNPNGQVYFMMSVANNSGAQVDNVNVLVNIPTEISSLGNLQVNGVPVSGDIVSGISIGSLAPASAKSITFEGKAQAFSTQGTKQAVATSNVSGATQSDSLAINLNPSQAAGASVSSATATSGWASFWSFLKRWYLWILVGLVLIFLFIIVFRRLSNNA